MHNVRGNTESGQLAHGASTATILKAFTRRELHRARRVWQTLEKICKGTAVHRSAAVALTIRLASAALAYASLGVIARLVGPHEFGIFAFAWVWFLVIAAVANLGFGDSTVRFVPLLRARGETSHLRGFVRFARLVVGIGSAAAALIAVIAIHSAGTWLDSRYVLPLTLMALTIPFVSLQSLLEGLGRSYGWIFSALAPIYILRHGLILAFVTLAAVLGFTPDAALAFGCVTLAVVVSLAYQAWAIGRRFRQAVTSGATAYRPREWIAGSAPFAILHGAGVIFSFADVITLSFFADPPQTAVYFAATRVIQVVNVIPYAARVAGSHRFSAAYAEGALDDIQRLASQMALMTFGSAVICLFGLAIGGDLLLRLFGNGFEAGYLPLLILSLGILAAMAAGPAEEILNMTGHGALSAWSSVVLVCVSIGLNIALILPFGVTGAAVATSLAVAGRGAWLAVAVRRRFGIRTSVIAALTRH